MRRIARELGVDLTAVTGTGPKGPHHQGRRARGVLRGRRRRRLPAGRRGRVQAFPEVPAQDFSKFGPIETRPLSRIKRLSGPHLHRSWLNIPHVTHNDEADITDLDAYRKELDTAAQGQGLPRDAACLPHEGIVSALKQFPEFNSSLSPEKDALILKSYYHIGVAVDTPDGLVVPVIRDVDRKGIREISQELGAVSAKARDGKLGPADMQGGTLHHLQPGRHRRHRLHADRQRPRGGDPRRGALEDGAGLGRHEFVPRLMLPVRCPTITGSSTARWPPVSPATSATLLEDVRRLVL